MLEFDGFNGLPLTYITIKYGGIGGSERESWESGEYGTYYMYMYMNTYVYTISMNQNLKLWSYDIDMIWIPYTCSTL
jgi:hypothetical protein